MRSDLPDELRGEFITLHKYHLSDADALKEAIATSYKYLHGWMVWAQKPPTGESILAFLAPAVEKFGAGADAHYATTLKEDGRYVGGCGLTPTVGESALEIGYWVDVRFLDRGIATQSARMLTEAAFGLESVERVEIHCDEANRRSAAVPRRLGYRLDRVESHELETPLATGRHMIWVAGRGASR